jgi:hypothetical protein
MATAKLTEGGMLHGLLGGRPVMCFLRTGVNIPKGQYLLLPPVEDPIYGTLVPMMPLDPAATSSGTRALAKHKEVALLPAVSKPTSYRHKEVALLPAVFKQTSSGTPAVKPGWGAPASADTGGWFILSANAMPGRNNAVVHLGFSDLVEGLKTGAETIEVT